MVSQSGQNTSRRSRSDAEIMAEIGIENILASERKRDRTALMSALGFIAPAALIVTIVLLLPVLCNIYLSFTKWKRFTGLGEYAGLSNYVKLSSNPFFAEAFANTAIWLLASIALPLIFGLALAILLRDTFGEGFIKNTIFIPRILAPTAVAVLWYYVYAPDGIVNWFLGLFRTEDVDIGWLYQDNTITPAIIATFVWQSTGLVMVLLLLGLAAIPRDPIEAATIDGANRWQIFRHITIPLLLPTILVVTILSALAGFTVFDLLWVMGASYPGQRTLSLAVFMYFEAFQKGSWAFGSAIAVVIGLVVLSVTWIQAALQSRIDRMIK
jgi:multiple sugar transport system permease protein